MGKYFRQISILCLVCILQTTTVYASDKNNTFYLSGKFITGFSDIENIQNTGAINGTAKNSETDDIVGGLSAAIGYKWQQFRVELEYLWRFRFDYGVQFFDGTPPTSISSDVETHSILVNTVWDFDNRTNFTPYVGGGLGWAGHEADTIRANLNTEATTSLNTSTDNFIWSLMLGTTYSFTNNWNADLGYRYTDLGDVEVGPFSDGGKVDSEYSSHDLTIGINYTF